MRTCVVAGERAKALAATARGFPAIGDVLGVVGNGWKGFFPLYVKNRLTTRLKNVTLTLTGECLYYGALGMSWNLHKLEKLFSFFLIFLCQKWGVSYCL